MKNKLFQNKLTHASLMILLGLCLSTTLICTSCDKSSENAASAATEEPADKNAPLLVYGEVKTDEIQELQIDFPARITAVTAKEGQTVKKGDPLMTLDMNDYKLQIATLESNLEGYTLKLKGVQSSNNSEAASIDALSKELALKKSYASSSQDPDILPLQNTLQTLNADLAEANHEYEANQALFESGALSQYELDQSKLNVDKLTAKLNDTTTAIQKAKDARQLEISTLQSKLSAASLTAGNVDTSKTSDINQLQVQIESTQLTLQNMKSKLTAPYLKDNQLVAPKDNLIIYSVPAVSGSSVSGLGQSLIQFMDLDSLYVTLDIPEESLSQVKLGTPVTLKVSDQSVTAPIAGKITRLSNFAKEKEGDTVVEAYVEVTSGKEFLEPGLSIDAYIEPLS